MESNTEISARILDNIQASIRKKYPAVCSLQSIDGTAYGHVQAVNPESEIIQIVCYRGHFLILSNIFVPEEERSHTLFVYDTLAFCMTIPPVEPRRSPERHSNASQRRDALRKISAQLLAVEEEEIILQWADIDQQPWGSNACGPFVACNAVALAEGMNPCTIKWDATNIRSSLLRVAVTFDIGLLLNLILSSRHEKSPLFECRKSRTWTDEPHVLHSDEHSTLGGDDELIDSETKFTSPMDSHQEEEAPSHLKKPNDIDGLSLSNILVESDEALLDNVQYFLEEEFIECDGLQVIGNMRTKRGFHPKKTEKLVQIIELRNGHYMTLSNST